MNTHEPERIESPLTDDRPSIIGWWHYSPNVAALYEWLCGRELLDREDATAVSYYFDKPWKWSPEYRAMMTSQKGR